MPNLILAVIFTLGLNIKSSLRILLFAGLLLTLHLYKQSKIHEIKQFSVLVLGKFELDPDSIGKDPLYDEDFRVEIHFKDACKKCKSEDQITKKCKKC
jgi:hypothetical protein